ncbi:hypothetical protein CcI49_03030 [Frankia sp. CcI49]|nr:hypothetical protein CcI49_03030 [Frankia sp. CcI49]
MDRMRAQLRRAQLVRDALEDARDCAAFDRYVYALLFAPLEDLSAPQRRQRAEIERVTLSEPEAEAALERQRAAGGTAAPAWPSRVVLAHLAAWLREMALEVAVPEPAPSRRPPTSRRVDRSAGRRSLAAAPIARTP